MRTLTHRLSGRVPSCQPAAPISLSLPEIESRISGLKLLAGSSPDKSERVYALREILRLRRQQLNAELKAITAAVALA